MSQHWIALTARIAEGGDPAGPPLRFGLSVNKRVARKSVQRNLVKRILREAIRQAIPQMTSAAVNRRVDAVLRMKAAFPTAERMALAPFRLALRAEADLLLRRLVDHLASPCG